MKLFTIILFAVTYILMIALPKKRPYVALVSAVIFVVSGAMPLASVFTAIDWNVLLMLAGTMGTVALFIESKMPERMADLLLQKTPNVMWVAVALSVFAGVVSAFVDNVATVLMIAPVALAIAKKLNLSPVALLICIAVCRIMYDRVSCNISGIHIFLKCDLHIAEHLITPCGS